MKTARKAKEKRTMYKRATLILLCIFAFVLPVHAAPAITVSASSISILGSSQTISLTCTLIDPNNTGNLRNGAGGVITVFVTNTTTPGSTATCGPIYGNDVITDGYGNSNTTYYKVQVFTVAAGIVASTPALQQFYAFTGSGTIDLSTATPLAPSFFTGPSGSVSMPGSLTVAGTTTLKYLNNIRFADQFTGGDCGAKINAADTDLGSTVGEIWVNQNCGTTWTTAVTLSAKHTIRFVQGGTYVHAGITFGQGASVAGAPCGDADSVSTCPVVLQSSTTLASALNLSGNESSCRDITLDGNNTGVLGALVTAQRVELNHCHAWRFTSHGIKVASTTATNDSAGAVRVVGTMSIGNGGDGLFCSAATDGVIGAQHNEFENNTGFGIEASDCSGWRVLHNDFGGNTAGGIKITGLSAWQGLGWTINANEFGNSKSHDIFIDGNNGGILAARDEVIVGNYFNGLGATATDNTYSGIHIQNSTGNTVTGNVCRSGSSPRYKYCIEITQPTLTEGTDTLAGNNFEGSFGTGYIFPQAATMCAGNNDAANLCAFKIPTGYGFASAGVPIVGAGSGTTTLVAASSAGGTATLPNNTGTIAELNLAQTWSANQSSMTLVSPTINLLTNGTGLQAFNTTTTCTTAGSVGATCTTAAISLPVAEADTSYRVTCTGKGITNVPVVIATTNSSATQFTITIAALTAAAATFASYDCIAGHN